MKKILSFLSYHNAVPAVLIALAVGGTSAFAASELGVPVPFIVQSLGGEVETPNVVDPAMLLAADIGAFDFRPTVMGVAETDTQYTISYSMDTLAPVAGAWTRFPKTGEFSVAKDALPDGGLNAYVVQKLGDIENQERSYLSRAQAAEQALAQVQSAQPASAFAALVGLTLNQIPVPVIEKPAGDIPPPEPPYVSDTVFPAIAPVSADDANGTTAATSTPPTEPEATSTEAPAPAPDNATSTPLQESYTPSTKTDTASTTEPQREQ